MDLMGSPNSLLADVNRANTGRHFYNNGIAIYLYDISTRNYEINPPRFVLHIDCRLRAKWMNQIPFQISDWYNIQRRPITRLKVVVPIWFNIPLCKLDDWISSSTPYQIYTPTIVWKHQTKRGQPRKRQVLHPYIILLYISVAQGHATIPTGLEYPVPTFLEKVKVTCFDV